MRTRGNIPHAVRGAQSATDQIVKRYNFVDIFRKKDLATRVVDNMLHVRIDCVQIRKSIWQGELRYLPIGMLIGGIFLAELLLVVGAWAIGPGVPQTITAPIPTKIPNTEAIGLVLYTRYIYFFEAAGMILLVAMVGAIVLTLHHRERVRRQSIAAQVARKPVTSIEVVKVRSGQGLGSNT